MSGFAVYSAVLNTSIKSKFSQIPGYGETFTAPSSAADYAALHALPDGPIKEAALVALTDSFATCWMIACGLLLGALAVSAQALIPSHFASLERFCSPPLRMRSPGHR